MIDSNRTPQNSNQNLTEEEQEILQAAESGELQSMLTAQRKNELEAIAKHTLD